MTAMRRLSWSGGTGVVASMKWTGTIVHVTIGTVERSSSTIITGITVSGRYAAERFRMQIGAANAQHELTGMLLRQAQRSLSCSSPKNSLTGIHR